MATFWQRCNLLYAFAKMETWEVQEMMKDDNEVMLTLINRGKKGKTISNIQQQWSSVSKNKSLLLSDSFYTITVKKKLIACISLPSLSLRWWIECCSFNSEWSNRGCMLSTYSVLYYCYLLFYLEILAKAKRWKAYRVSIYFLRGRGKSELRLNYSKSRASS